MTASSIDAQTATFALLADRAAGATICPSEVARRLTRPAGSDPTTVDWRDMMPAVHAAVDQLVADGRVRLSWKGQSLASRAGPYRIARGKPDEA